MSVHISPRRLERLPPPPSLAALAASSIDARAAILRRRGTPLVDGEASTFVHLGEADRVVVRHFMARFPEIPPLEPVADGIQAVTVALPERSRVEYKLEVTREGRTDQILDAFNPHQATDPFGANSVAFGPGYVTPWWADPSTRGRVGLRRGFVQSTAFERRRFVHWYHPDGGAHDLPLLVVHDGKDFVEHAGIVDALDNLIARGAIAPTAAALIDPADRALEYADDPRHAEFVSEVVDAAIRRHGATADRSRHVYLGASMGAVAALSAAWRGPSPGGLVLLSGSFVGKLGGPMGRDSSFQPIVDFVLRFRAAPGRPAQRIYQSCGEYEGLAPDNRAFRRVLAATGADHRYEEARDGHHWHNWRDRLGAALTHTLPSAGAEIAGTVPA